MLNKNAVLYVLLLSLLGLGFLSYHQHKKIEQLIASASLSDTASSVDVIQNTVDAIKDDIASIDDEIVNIKPTQDTVIDYFTARYGSEDRK